MLTTRGIGPAALGGTSPIYPAYKNEASPRAAGAPALDEDVAPTLRRQLEADSARLGKRLHQIEAGDYQWPPLSSLGSRGARNGEGRSVSAAVSPRQSTGEATWQDRSERAAGSASVDHSCDGAFAYSPQGTVVQQNQRASSRRASVNSPYQDIAPSPKVRQALAQRRAQAQAQSSQLQRVTSQTGGVDPAASTSAVLDTPWSPTEHADDADLSNASLSQSIARSVSVKRRMARAAPTEAELQEFGGPLGGATLRSRKQSFYEDESVEESYAARRRRRRDSAGSTSFAAAQGSAIDFGSPSTASPMQRQARQRTQSEGASSRLSSRNLAEDAARHADLLPSPPNSAKRAAFAPVQGRAAQPNLETIEMGVRKQQQPSNPWDEELIPTVARKLQQEELLKRDPRLSHVNGLIDTWDRDGLPLSLASRNNEQRRGSRPDQLQASNQPSQPEQRTTGDATALQQNEQPQQGLQHQQPQQIRIQQSNARTSQQPKPINDTTISTNRDEPRPATKPKPAPITPQKGSDNDVGCCRCAIM